MGTQPLFYFPVVFIFVCVYLQTPNLFAAAPSIVRDGVEALCPKDNKFLPVIPEEVCFLCFVCYFMLFCH